MRRPADNLTPASLLIPEPATEPAEEHPAMVRFAPIQSEKDFNDIPASAGMTKFVFDWLGGLRVAMR